MTRKITAVVVGVAIASAGAAYVVAQDEGGRGHGPRGDRGAMLERFDADKDGKLDEQEREAAREARKAEMLQRFDTDKDGKLSDAEREAAKAEFRGHREGYRKGRHEARRAQMLEKFTPTRTAPWTRASARR